MRQLKVGTLPLPEIYVVDNEIDISNCKKLGVPFIIWKDDYELLIKLVLFPTLKKMFPYIKWEEYLGIRECIYGSGTPVIHKPISNKQLDKSTTKNSVSFNDVKEWQENKIEQLNHNEPIESKGDHYGYDSGSIYERVMDSNGLDSSLCQVSLNDCVGDLSMYVNIDELNALHLLPKWIGDINDCIRTNIQDYIWQEGYNKKTGIPIGNFITNSNLKNLLIIDVSMSIPAGIAATMLALCDTLRNKINADLIITGATSGFYPINESIPSAQELRQLHGRSNESKMFYSILNEKIFGREWGNVIAFGDNDTPSSCNYLTDTAYNIANYQDRSSLWSNNGKRTTKVHRLYSFHTKRYNRCPPIVGYAKWVKCVCPDVEVIHNTDWIDSIKSGDEID